MVAISIRIIIFCAKLKKKKKKYIYIYIHAYATLYIIIIPIRRKNKNVGTKLVPQNNNTRRSYRLNLQSILQEGASKKNYVDPDSDMYSPPQKKKKIFI